MTVICALASDEGTFIGSDTLLVAGSRTVDGVPKWYCWRNWAVALAGDWRVANIINNKKEQLLAKLKNENEFVERLYKLLDYITSSPVFICKIVIEILVYVIYYAYLCIS